MEKIYEQKVVPDQWKISRIIPLHKKGPKKEMSNYRPISNLCAISKIFEKLILRKLQQVGEEQEWNIGGNCQHGFKTNKSTVTAIQEIVSRVSHYTDQNYYVALASLDLSAAFDVVPVDLLLKRMKTIGLPEDVIGLIRSWLEKRSAYVEVEDSCSEYYDITAGTIQGSILGPILFNIFMEPLMEVEDSVSYADDSYNIELGDTKIAALKDLELKLIRVEKWMSGSGLKVNLEKTELIIFHRMDTSQGSIKLKGFTICSKHEINILGISVDSRLTWDPQVERAISGAKRNCQALRIIRRYFTKEELKTLVTTCVYAKLYYGAGVWLTSVLRERLWKRLYSFSGITLKLLDKEKTYGRLHKENIRATPKMYSNYLLAISYYDLMKTREPLIEFNNCMQVELHNRRNNCLLFTSNARYRIGRNNISKRIVSITNKIKKAWLDLDKISFKLACKRLFIYEALQEI